MNGFKKGPGRVTGLLFCYVLTVILSIGIANYVRSWSLSQLYAVYKDDHAIVSVIRAKPLELEKILDLILADKQVIQQISDYSRHPHEGHRKKMILYAMPRDWSASEIPMKHVESAPDHFDYQPEKEYQNLRVVITQSLQRDKRDVSGMDILSNTSGRIPLAEVIVNLEKQYIIDVSGPVEGHSLENIPLPVF